MHLCFKNIEAMLGPGQKFWGKILGPGLLPISRLPLQINIILKPKLLSQRGHMERQQRTKRLKLTSMHRDSCWTDLSGRERPLPCCCCCGARVGPAPEKPSAVALGRRLLLRLRQVRRAAAAAQRRRHRVPVRCKRRVGDQSQWNYTG